MSKLIIKGDKKIKGSIKISGNKNSVLPIFAASILTEKKCIIKNVPDIKDKDAMIDIMQDIGVNIKKISKNSYEIQAKNINTTNLNPELTNKLRGCITLMGALTARFKNMTMPNPGGCIIGKRPLDAHLQVLKEFGCKVESKKLNNNDVYKISNKNLRGVNIFLGEQSVTATENAMLMAVLAHGKSVIENAAAEPHVQDVANFLNKMGAKITGIGTNTITITGVKKLKGTTHKLRSDYVEAISFACLAAASKSHLKLTNIVSGDLKMPLHIFRKMNIEYKTTNNSLEIFPSNIKAVDKIQDGLWPALSPDAISPFVILATQAKGTTLIQQWMFEGRLFFVDKLSLMGANITLCDPHRVIINGPVKLMGKKVISPDLRAGISLVIAALIAKGTTEIDNAYQIDRGYEDVVKRLQKVGADIKRINS